MGQQNVLEVYAHGNQLKTLAGITKLFPQPCTKRDINTPLQQPHPRINNALELTEA